MNKRSVAVIIRDGKILLMHRIKNGEQYFVFPGGGVQDGETVETGVVREIKEEFGIDIKIEKLLFQIENQGREEFYFLVKEFTGTPEIGGEEKERMSEVNRYFSVWKNLNEIKTLVNLYPEQAKQKIGELIE